MVWEAKSSPKTFRREPWLHPEVTKHLNSLIQPEWIVFEHGAGGSTLWLSDRCKHVVSLEHDEKWYRAVAERSPENVSLVFGRSLPPKLMSIKYDLIYIDGERYARPKWIGLAPDMIKPGGYIVLDNANRPEYAAGRNMLQAMAESYKIFDKNRGAYRFIVTDFYKMKG